MKLLAIGTIAVLFITQARAATTAIDRIVGRMLYRRELQESRKHAEVERSRLSPTSVTAIVEPVTASKESFQTFLGQQALRDESEKQDHAPRLTIYDPSENVPDRGVVHIGRRIGNFRSYPAVFISRDDPEWILKYTVDCHTENQALDYFLQDVAAQIGVALPVAYLSPPSFMENKKLEMLFGWTCPLEDGGNVRYQLERRKGSNLAESEYGPMNAAAAIYTAKHVVEMVHTLHRAGIVHRNLNPNNIVYEYSVGGSENTLRFDDFTSADIVDQDTPPNTVDDEAPLTKKDDVVNALYLLEFLLRMNPAGTRTDDFFASMPYLGTDRKRKSHDCLIHLMRKLHDLPEKPDELPYEAFSEYLKRAWDALTSPDPNSRGCESGI